MNIIGKIVSGLVGATLVLSASLASAGTIAYASGKNNPWGNTTNDTAMNSAFGSGNWTRFNAYTLDVFTGAEFVFLDGSDSNANEFSSFLAANSAQIASYVTNGGHLFLNAAPNQGSSFDMGFGVQLKYTDFSSSVTVTAAGVAAGLTEGGLTTNYTGSSFAHATVSGADLSNLIAGPTGTVFGAKSVGAGFVAFGGQTTTNFHFPSSDSKALLVNELRYVDGGVGVVPEPASVVLFGLGMTFLVAMRRRKSAK